MSTQNNINNLKKPKRKLSFKLNLGRIFKRKDKVANTYVVNNTNLKLEDIESINLINKIDNISFEHIIDSEVNKSGLINYIVFDCFYTDSESQDKIIYVLVNEKIAVNDFNRLLLKLDYLKKGYLYCEIYKSTQASIISAKTQYKNKGLVQDNRVNSSQWQVHFNGILEKAIRLGSSDVHITAKGQTATVKARVNGDLVEIDRYTYSDMVRLISSAYNLFASKDSKGDAFATDLTLETGIHKILNNRPYNLRFISKPIYPAGSFDVTMRVIDEDFHKPLKELGYSVDHLKVLSRVIAQPNGLIVLAGRVGSGKSLTIHSMCTDYIARATHNKVITKKLVTFESPVEYQIKGAKQVEYKRDNNRTQEQEKLYFDSQVQSLLRMDTNAVVLGEIRGESVAQLAIQLVQSDNIVLTTVHAQSALKIFNRLNHLGMSKEVLTEPNFFQAMVYQTLVKVPCHHCSIGIDQDIELKLRIEKLINLYGLDISLLANVRIVNKQGCEHCHFGVNGRTLVAEIVEPTMQILESLKDGEFNKAYKLWRDGGGVTYQEHALEKILKGDICPVAYEDKVSPLVNDGFYAEVDKDLYSKIFKNTEWGDINA